nr:hypothetical protein [Tanacetum cinerariifolium]
KEDRPEVTLPPRKRLDIALGPRYEVGESSSAAAARPDGGFRADYGFVSTVDREIMRDLEREVGYGVTDSWDEIVETLQGAPTERQLLAGRLNMLFRNRRAHAYTRQLMEKEARMSRKAWARVTDASDLVHGEVISLRTTVLGQISEIRELQAADRRRQTTVGYEAAYGMSWKTLMKMMTDKYCPRNEIRKLERELWELKVKGIDLASYTQHFQVLAFLCGRMFAEEADKIEKYVGGLPDMIYGSVVASKPKTMQEAIEIATELMDKKVLTFAERETASKRKLENTSRTTQNQQQ